MKKQLFLYMIIIIFAGLFGFFAVSVYAAHSANVNFAKDTVMETAGVYANLYTGETNINSFVQTGTDTRVTVIAPNGRVFADSRPLAVGALENHLSRPEIQAAANGTPAAFIRYSNTLGVDLMYYAIKKEMGDSYVFIRTAIPIAKINTYLYTSLPAFVFTLFIVALICFVFTRKMISRVTRPLESIEKKLRSLSNGVYWHSDCTSDTAAGSYDEINEITQGINEVAVVLWNSFSALGNEKNMRDYILNNISDGLFLVDENKSIVLVNASAITIFNAKTSVSGNNLNYLSYDKALTAAVDDSVKSGKSALFEMTLDGQIYLTAVKRLPETSLTMIALSDVTENRENAKRREEFFANASHELKTPLTAIRGFNELAGLHNKDENIRKYIESVARETDRMLLLAGDMLKLSELENTREIKNPEPISLAKTVTEVQSVLSTIINEKSIAFETEGDAVITAEPEHIYELVKNLAENAARYNNQNGKISIRIETVKGSARLIVTDNGIGIPAEEQTRIFERFYRVEKSRSQKNGGTGLGLSIVKHICVLYGWELSLQSKPGAGTEVTVIFDKPIQNTPYYPK
jgi:two-component system phosphate regulon sensor histidine kinase PhoR